LLWIINKYCIDAAPSRRASTGADKETHGLTRFRPRPQENFKLVFARLVSALWRRNIGGPAQCGAGTYRRAGPR
jgi:hypothetical protein